MEDHEPLSFSVTYRLREYLSLVRSHVLATAGQPRPTRLDRFNVTVTLAVVGTVMFLIKSRRVGSCEFHVDADGITRTSNEGPVLVPWSDVVALHTYEAGYLIELGEGAMPVPYRVLSPGEVERFPLVVSCFADRANGSPVSCSTHDLPGGT